MQTQQIRVAFRRQFLGGDVGEGAVEVVDAVEQVLGEALEGEVPCGDHFAFGLVLQVAVVGCCAFEAVLGLLVLVREGANGLFWGEVVGVLLVL